MIRPSESLPGTHLNSVWVEGVLEADPVDLSHEHGSSCRFRVRTERPADSDPVSVFLVEASESALAGCRHRLARGRGVRIIGRIQQHRWKDPRGQAYRGVKIVGEMIETVALPV